MGYQESADFMSDMCRIIRFYVFGQQRVQSMATYAQYNMFAGTPADFTPGLASAVIIFVLGIIVSLILVSMIRDVVKQV